MRDESEWNARLAAMEARLARADAYQAITHLKAEYGSLADARYTRSGPKSQPEIDSLADRIANLFTEDGVWDGGQALGRCAGRAAIRDRFREPTLQFSWHFFVKPKIEVDVDQASGVWDVLALCTTLEGRAMWMVGVERDEYARVEGRWLHSHMKLDAKLMAPHDGGWGAER